MTDQDTSRLPGDPTQPLLEIPADEPSIEEQAMAVAAEQLHERTKEELQRKAVEKAMSKPARQIKGNSVVYDWLKSKTGVVAAPDSEPVTADDPELREFTLERTEDRTLRFQGKLIGWNEVKNFETLPRGTQVQIYMTKSGKIITAVYQWDRTYSADRSRRKAAAHSSPEDALNWLIKDGRGRLGRASKLAWEMACKEEKTLKGHDVEVID